MRLYSTKNTSKFVSLKEAVFKGLPEDNGLYMPEFIPKLPASFFQNIKNYSFAELAFEVSKVLLNNAIPEKDLENIINRSISFPAPLKTLDKDLHILELFHGPSLAFKDFGARFMSQLMSYFNQDHKNELIILVATSGDTGGAVAAGFYNTPGIEVVILYPSKKVSLLQEKQLTTLGKNISAIEVNGTFDDCQALVKQSFLDQELCKQLRLSSANSINIARLIPQSFYYFEAFKQLSDPSKPVAFSIPSGNFGNLTAGLIAKKMGLPVHKFIAATNVNNVVPEYLTTGIYSPRPSVRTISNAMDVGNPSNFARMDNFYCSTWNNMTQDIKGYSFTDMETKVGIREVYQKYNYIIDPHGSIGYLALKAFRDQNPNIQGIVLETAHPSKFKDDLESIINKPVDIPERLSILAGLEKDASFMEPKYELFKSWLLSKY